MTRTVLLAFRAAAQESVLGGAGSQGVQGYLSMSTLVAAGAAAKSHQLSGPIRGAGDRYPTSARAAAGSGVSEGEIDHV